MSGTPLRYKEQRGHALADQAREARAEALGETTQQTSVSGGFGGERLSQETTGKCRRCAQARPGGSDRGDRCQGSKVGTRASVQPESVGILSPSIPPAHLVQMPAPQVQLHSDRLSTNVGKAPSPAGPMGSYAKGGSEIGLMGGVGIAGGVPPSAQPSVKERLAQVGPAPKGWYRGKRQRSGNG